MKRTWLASLLALCLAATLLAGCTDKKEYDDYEERHPNATEKVTPEEEPDGMQNAGADTEEGWGPLQH